MPIPFIAGAILGAAAVIAYNKGGCLKDKISSFDSEEFAKKAGKITESAILKVKNLGCPCKETAKKTTKKAAK